MQVNKVMLVFNKDWTEIKRNNQVMLPILIVPLIFAVIFPLLMGGISSQPSNGVDTLMKILPPDVLSIISGMSPEQALFYIMLSSFILPIFFIIPLIASSVIASDSFAGEKERKTLEALLAAPFSDQELLLGKILVAFVPAMLVTLISFGVFSILVNIVSYQTFGSTIPFPNLTWMVAIFIFSPLLSLAGIGVTVVVSSIVRGYREAQQISGLLVLPVIALVLGQASGMLFLTPMLMLLLAVIFAAVDVLVFYVGLRLFAREEILSKM